MTMESAVVSESAQVASETPNQDSSACHGGDKQPITPAKRWALICENVYERAQKRGFVGGNPLQDLAEAAEEIDAAYKTDFNCIFSLTSTAEITEQLRSLFAGYGFDQEELDNLLDEHQDGLEKLAARNRDMLDGASGLVAKQTQLLQNVASESAKTLQSIVQGRLRPEGCLNIAKLSMEAFDSALTGLLGSTKPVAKAPEGRSRETSGSALLQGAVVSDYDGQSATQLMDAPVTALKGISDSLGKKLKEEFAVSTIREMAANELAEWAHTVVMLADASPPARTVADSRIAEARNLCQSQASFLKEGFGIETVRDLGAHPLFNAARTIVLLAEAEG